MQLLLLAIIRQDLYAPSLLKNDTTYHTHHKHNISHTSQTHITNMSHTIKLLRMTHSANAQKKKEHLKQM